jgi:glutaminyl-tRNA synthetase
MVKDEKTGEITEVHCTYDPETRNGPPPDGRKVEGVIHWVSAEHSISAEVRLYDRLFQVADPMGQDDDFIKYLNPKSLETLKSCRVEPSLASAVPGSRFQFERIGYFCVDSKDSSPGKLVFNRIVTLRDSWAKVSGQENK